MDNTLLYHFNTLHDLGEFAHGLTAVLAHLYGFFLTVFGVLVGDLAFAVQECNRQNCPGSAYNAITAAWANIGYMTHSDFLYLITDTKFGYWAALLYAIGAVGALVSVALNSPPRQWVWFLIGPGLYWFLVDTQKDVTGVAWRVAGKDLPMQEVWKNAETGLANTQLVQRLGLQVNKEGSPGQYPVAYPLILLDDVFSATTNRLISFIGMSRQEGRGGSDSNLARKEGQEEGPWYLLSTMKWGMLENIVGVQARDPDVRDALVTFLASECGDHFKKGVDAGNYLAASQARGVKLPSRVLKGTWDTEFDGLQEKIVSRYQEFAQGLDTDVIPTPRALIRLFGQDPDTRGSFRQFSQKFGGATNEADRSGRTVEIVCSEYLYVILQALRWESGHAFWQLVRSAPDGFTRTSILKSLFYGWDVRVQSDAEMAEGEQYEHFTKYLILVYMLRNELMFAPQITEAGQRFAPSEQTRNFTESYVRAQGSRAKAGELYNWAVMMPYVQGILTYIILIAYPFAAMLMVIPGYWKAFFTWITFFAWVKIWDVGFALVHTLERSVWAMIGNNSSMSRVASLLIQSAEEVGTVEVGKDGACSGPNLRRLCAVPDVKEQSDLSMEQAWYLLDNALLLSGSADLDLANGYYIYIMAALYFAVPAVTGQLVLGAKAGLGNLAFNSVSQNASEAGGAAKSGTVGEAINRLSTNQQSLGQAAKAKSLRQSGLALQHFENANAAMDADIAGQRIGAVGKQYEAIAGAKGLTQKSHGLAVGEWQALGDLRKGKASQNDSSTDAGTGLGDDAAKAANAAATTVNKSGGIGGAFQSLLGYGMGAQSRDLNGAAQAASARSGALGLNLGLDGAVNSLRSGGFKSYGGRLEQQADFGAQTAAWEAKNDFATHLSGIGGIAGLNPGSLAPGAKPDSMAGLALAGDLGSGAQRAARYSGFGFMDGVSAFRQNNAHRGSQSYMHNWQPFSMFGAVGGGVGTAESRVTGGISSGWQGLQKMWSDVSQIKADPVGYFSKAAQGSDVSKGYENTASVLTADNIQQGVTASVEWLNGPKPETPKAEPPTPLPIEKR
jgi:hypothetical protein